MVTEDGEKRGCYSKRRVIRRVILSLLAAGAILRFGVMPLFSARAVIEIGLTSVELDRIKPLDEFNTREHEKLNVVERDSVTSQSSSSCDFNCYIERYPDLLQFKGNLADAQDHYERYGKAEGRKCDCIASTTSSSCDFMCYIERYPDVHLLYRGNLAGGQEHYDKIGKAEGRTCDCLVSTPSSLCDFNCYIERHPDLVGFKGNLAGAQKHYEEWGHAEGRICTCHVCNLPAVVNSVHIGIPLSYMPRNGYGTCCRWSANGGALLKSLTEYLSHGGRLIDTAIMYHNHEVVGEAIQASQVPRATLWVTTKLQGYQLGRVPGLDNMPGSHKGEYVLAEMSSADLISRTLELITTSLKELCLEYLDLVLIHNPTSLAGVDDGIWLGLIEAKKMGIVKHIGLSNFGQESIEKFRRVDPSYPPEVLQSYYFPASPPQQAELSRWCKAQGMRFTAIGSLGGSRHSLGSAQKEVMPCVQELARKYKATAGQILLRWALDQGLDVIPGSFNHIKENLDLDYFRLAPEEISRITRDAQMNTQDWYLQS